MPYWSFSVGLQCWKAWHLVAIIAISLFMSINSCFEPHLTTYMAPLAKLFMIPLKGFKFKYMDGQIKRLAALKLILKSSSVEVTFGNQFQGTQASPHSLTIWIGICSFLFQIYNYAASKPPNGQPNHWL